MQKVVVLGAGLVGGPVALDMAGHPEVMVIAVDVREEALKRLQGKDNLKPVRADVRREEEVKDLVSDANLVINATPGFMGFSVLERLISLGKNVVDIAFFPEDPLELDRLAKEHQCTVVVDCGVAPGMSNILTGYGYFQLDVTERALTLVGGLPAVRRWPYEYKAVFSPIDVIEEYTRPARYLENGKMVVKEALSDPELLDFEGIGTLEAFNTDGIRTMSKTLSIPNLKEKTLRYPGHIEKMRLLRETGFFSKNPVVIDGKEIRPIDFTSQLLFPMWKLEDNEEDLTIMRVEVEGKKGGEQVLYRWELLDRRDPITGIHSMARTTGYTATAVASLILEGSIREKGIIPPELLGKKAAGVEAILNYLRRRGVIYRQTILNRKN